MGIELWWLLALPAFFVMGWVAARIDIRHVIRESRALPRSYFKGLNFLLNEQPDKAIEAFLEAAKAARMTRDRGATRFVSRKKRSSTARSFLMASPSSSTNAAARSSQTRARIKPAPRWPAA